MLDQRVRELKPSATLAINELSNQLILEGRTIYKMGLGQSPFPVPVPLVAAMRLHAAEKDYLPVAGLPSLREAICNFHRRREGITAGSEEVIIGPGSKELLFLLQMVYDCVVMLPTPCWVSYGPQACLTGREIHTIPTGFDTHWKLTPDLLDQACQNRDFTKKPGLLILNYPNNPFGQTYSEEELKSISSIARKYGLIILADEIYGELQFEGTHVSLARYYPEGTIISSGLSKWAGAGGWRLGYFLFPEKLKFLRDAMCAVASETYTSVSAPTQYAAVTAFQASYEIDRYLFLSRKILKALGMECTRILREGGLELHNPTGAFYLFPNFAKTEKAREFKTSESLCRSLLEDTGVAILPGSEFMRDPSEMTARLAYVDFDGSRALMACSSLPDSEVPGEEFLSQYCENVVEGMKKIQSWALCE